MSMVRELIGAVSEAERHLDEQTMRLTSYKADMERVMRRVEAALAGSERRYNQRMVDQIDATRAQVDATLQELQAAKEKLQRVRMI